MKNNESFDYSFIGYWSCYLEKKKKEKKRNETKRNKMIVLKIVVAMGFAIVVMVCIHNWDWEQVLKND